MVGRHHRPKPEGWAARRGAWLTAENRVLARRLWDEGLFASQIAKVIGCGATPNAIIGHAHRSDFPPRPSPLNRPKGAPPNEVRPRKPDGTHHGKVLTMAPRKAPPPPEALVAPPPPPPPVRTCQWIEAPDRPWGELCGRPCRLHPRSGVSTAWCAEHYRRVYTQHRDRDWPEAAD